MNGIFTISLDFELHWGGFEKWPLEFQNPNPMANRAAYKIQDPTGYNAYFLNTRKTIPKMLELFEKYGIHVTWATVGMLLNTSKSELLENAPALKPKYSAPNLSAYHYIDTVGIGEDETSDPFHFGSTLVKKILETPHQELGTHTFAHYYCNEEGQSLDQFRDDLRAAQRVAKKYGQQFRSLVFPRNQFNDAYLKVCFEEGITSVRSNPHDWFWNIDSTQNESMWKRLNRGMDAYFPIGKKNTYSLKSLEVRAGYPVCQPASRLLRPYNPKEFLLNDLKINHIKDEMKSAARNGEVYHVWWHPHNFGNYPQQSLDGLEKILKEFLNCHKQLNMRSMNMGEITSVLVNG